MAQQPADEEGWNTIEQRGLQAAEVANLVAMRPAKPPQDEWLMASANLQDAGVTLAKAAKAASSWSRGSTSPASVTITSCHFLSATILPLVGPITARRFPNLAVPVAPLPIAPLKLAVPVAPR
jgi:uncharacterized membrane protein